MNFKQGDQIVYVPTHADGNSGHPDCEDGFVMYIGSDSVYCRFWQKGDGRLLRTLSNSESCPALNLVKIDKRPQEMIDKLVDEITINCGGVAPGIDYEIR